MKSWQLQCTNCTQQTICSCSVLQRAQPTATARQLTALSTTVHTQERIAQCTTFPRPRQGLARPHTLAGAALSSCASCIAAARSCACSSSRSSSSLAVAALASPLQPARMSVTNGLPGKQVVRKDSASSLQMYSQIAREQIHTQDLPALIDMLALVPTKSNCR